MTYPRSAQGARGPELGYFILERPEGARRPEPHRKPHADSKRSCVSRDTERTARLPHNLGN